jgi:peptidoglycan/LPS O-acetylase OafA/YrhL
VTRERLPELDAVRGLAALTVLLHHCAFVLPAFAATHWPRHHGLLTVAKRTPLAALTAGHEAVMLFFVLSGFVLALPYIAGEHESYGRFAVRRVCRIWIPYAAALLVAGLARWALADRPLHGVSALFTLPWHTGPFTGTELLGHVSLVGSFDPWQLDPVVWSLVHEMRISLVFPVLVLLCLRGRWWHIAMVALAADALLWLAPGTPADGGLLLTAHYGVLFVGGIVLARDRRRVVAAVVGWSRTGRLWLAAVSLACYTAALMQPALSRHGRPFGDLLSGVGSLGFITLALAAGRVTSALRSPIPSFLGRISYSLYLLHVVVLLVLLHALSGRLPLPLLIGCGFGASLLVAWLSQRWVERPSINLGRRLTRRAAV